MNADRTRLCPAASSVLSQYRVGYRYYWALGCMAVPGALKKETGLWAQISPSQHLTFLRFLSCGQQGQAS